MAGTISMQDMRYLNLFGKITRVNTRFCFEYNNAIIFCVPRSLIRKALGDNGRNIKQLNEIMNKRIKVIPIPQNESHIGPFIKAIISPVEFKDIEIKDNEVILTGGSHNKAALIGRNKRRLLEMQKIIKDFFGKEFRIV